MMQPFWGWRGLASEVVQEELDAVDCAEEVDVDCLEVGLLRWGGGIWCSEGGEEGAICDAGVGGEDGDTGAPVEYFKVLVSGHVVVTGRAPVPLRKSSTWLPQSDVPVWTKRVFAPRLCPMASPLRLMSAMTTRQPLERRSLVKATPIPDAAPVMMAPLADILCWGEET